MRNKFMPTFIAIVRWIALLPVAVLAGWLGYFLMAWAWNISLTMQGIDLTEFRIRALHMAASGLAMGAAFVYGGTYTAPSYRSHIAVSLAILAGLFFGATITLAIVMADDPDYWAIWQGLCLVLGAGVSAIVITTEGLRNPLW